MCRLARIFGLTTEYDINGNKAVYNHFKVIMASNFTFGSMRILNFPVYMISKFLPKESTQILFVFAYDDYLSSCLHHIGLILILHITLDIRISYLTIFAETFPDLVVIEPM